MSTKRSDPRVGLQVLIRHLRALVAYYKKSRTNVRGLIQDHTVLCRVLTNVDMEYELMFFRYYGAAEVFDTAIAGLQETLTFATRPFGRRRGTPTIKEAATRLHGILVRITDRVLGLAEAELKARYLLHRGLCPKETDGLEAEIMRRLERAIDAESSQRVVALETVASSLRAVVTIFASMFPGGSAES